ncbi:MAG: hypothetical protein V1781_02810, partial [Bacteroidota bacterium]
YASAPQNINQYFDLEAIRDAQQVIFTGHVGAKQTHTIVKHTFGAEDSVKLENIGTTDLQFYLSPTKDALPKQAGLLLSSGAKQTVFAYTLGNLSDPFLIVFNPHTVEKGEFVMEIV